MANEDCRQVWGFLEELQTGLCGGLCQSELESAERLWKMSEGLVGEKFDYFGRI